MKKVTMMFVLLMTLIITVSNASIVPDSRISKVTVYPDRALVTRTAEFQLESGVQEIRFGALPAGIDPSSIRVRAEGLKGIKIIGMDVAKKFTTETVNESVRQIESEIQELNDQLLVKDQAILMAQSEKEFYLSIKAKASQDAQDKLTGNKTTLEDFQATAQFAFNGIKTSMESEHKNQIERREIEKSIQKLQNDLNQIKSGPSKEYYETVITLESSRPGPVQMELDYHLSGASWRPVYDARFDPVTEKVEWTYAAMVTQKTSESWDDIAITLSTARPDLGAGLSELNPWIVQVWEAIRESKHGFLGGMRKEAAAPMPAAAVEGYADTTSSKEEELVKADVVTATVESSGQAVQFVIPARATIPGDGTTKRVTIAVHEFASELSYHAIPKMSEHAYLSAKIKNTTETPFLAGELRAFSGNTLAGNNTIKAVAPGEEFDLALGADDRIKIKRITVHQDRDKTGLFTSKIHWNYEYKTELQSFVKHPVVIRIQDQMPVSRDSRVVILDVTSVPKADATDDNGITEWKLTLEPDKKTEIKYGFAVEYPADANVSGL